ncbi:hypothetical protein HS088_TW14G00335 [Tripterygium wilfordii]|uniref:Uncharacterized protein n=1 Tax=Tripterygium wilfordii TaxID=458696 RepID=A0A7J7CQG3_TRIWF|nr:uncharacterized protein LOC120015231 [Tripterygium wilfordii]KAF5736199.1 hypothetical protein HS088_TW14G00335 [Tripterygium wilfordii]
MGPDLDFKEPSEFPMEVSARKNGNISRDAEDKPMQCASNYEDNNFDMDVVNKDQNKLQYGSQDVEVNVTECTNSSDIGKVEDNYQDATESMSSFGDTVSSTENNSMLSDTEVESSLRYRNTSPSIIDGCGGAFQTRRKKLTDHWRNFVHPLMWRCKWMELQIKELHSQALKYDRELAEYDERKQFDCEKSALEGFDAKSLPYSSYIQRKKVMQRKKRRRIEDTVDMASYMLQHNVFSYYVTKRPTVHGASMDNSFGSLNKTVNHNDEFGFHDRGSSLEFREDDNTLEPILKKVEMMQSQVHNLKSRIDKVLSENPGKFCSINDLSLLASVDASTSSGLAASRKNGNKKDVKALNTFSEHMSNCDVGDLMPEAVVSSHREVNPFPDMIERMGQPQTGVLCEHTGEGLVLHNQAAKELLQNFDSTMNLLTETPLEPTKEQTVSAPGVVLALETSVPHEQSNVKSLSNSRSRVSNSKRKQGRRNSGMGGQSRRS